MSELKKEIEMIRDNAKEYLDEYIKDNSDDAWKGYMRRQTNTINYSKHLACYDVANGLLKVLEKKNK